MTHLKALIFRFDVAFHHAFAEGAHHGHSVFKHVIAEVAGAAVERCHFGIQLCWLQTLLGCHTYGAARRRNHYHVGTCLADGVHAFLEAFFALSGSAVIFANMHMDDGCAGVGGCFCLTHQFLYGIGNCRVLFFGYLCSADCGSNYKFLHAFVCRLIVFDSLVSFANHAGAGSAAYQNRFCELIGCRS